MKTNFNSECAIILLLAVSNLSAATRYVSLESTNPSPPYTNWVTAATNIQQAVGAAAVGDVVVVTNGVYAGGVAVTNPLTLLSVNGPQFTVINGGGRNQCVSLADGASLSGFTLTNGVASSGGGVGCASTNAFLTNCTLTGNWALDGGGAHGCTLYNCTLTGNSAWGCGGGASGSTLNNCVVSGNTGGGAIGGTLNNCTVTGNSGWGVSSATLNNCIVYFNSNPNGGNYDPYSTLNYCCTTPLPTNGVGNLALDPQLASTSHLSAESPCRGAGSAAYTTGTDIDGEAWGNPPSIGCDEYHAGAVTGPLTVGLVASYTDVAVGFPVDLTALIEGRTTGSVWDFGDGGAATNQPYVTHSWTQPGDYLVALRAINESHAGGVSANLAIRVLAHSVYYVAATSTNPQPPYASWSTAASNIQDAVDTAVPGGQIVVTNGTYATGVRWVNRVAVDKPLTVRSVNGPEATIIDGLGAVRCLELANAATLVGFTLANGVAEVYGGGVCCESASAVLSNCVLTGNSAFGFDWWGGSSGAGGGTYGGTLNNCTLTGNSATGSSGWRGYCPPGLGGGAAYATLNNCTLTGNRANRGRSIDRTPLPGQGGGAYGCTLNNCTVTGNSGGGASAATLNNCTVTGNSGVGASAATLNNCIVYFNSDPNGGNYDTSSTLNYCCTTPMPTNGVGNISADPQLASASHLSAESPCIGAGSGTYARGTDIDGEAWANPPSIGCDEYHAGAVTGPLTVSLTATLTNVLVGHPVGLTAFIEGRTDLSVWEFGDGFVQVNEPYTSHTWTAPGYYLVALWAFNDSHPEGVSATATIYVDEGVHYVATSSASPVAPYTSWATAARNIQDAVDVAAPGATIFVTNGTYAAGGRTTPSLWDGTPNRLAVDKPLTVRSVNGPGVTVIQGQMPGAINGDMRCVYLTNAATLVGFTLTKGVAIYGGGVYCESSAVLSNCVLSANSAPSGYGGGACGCTLNNCTLTGNSAGNGTGGGAFGSTLNNCTLTGNSAYDGGGDYGSTVNNCTLTGNSATRSGGGASASTLYNCIVWFNTAAEGPNYDSCYNLNYCCTTPLPPGAGNVSADPRLTDSAHISADSPCVGAGSSNYTSGTDIDGEAWANPPSIGCDQFHAGPATGPLAVSIAPDYTNATVGFVLNFTARIDGHALLDVWDFDDGTFATRQPCGLPHSFASVGDYIVTLWAHNDSYPEGVSASLVIHVDTGLHYVSASNQNPVAPYTSWATAATNIQDAVDVAGVGGTVLVTNGTYAVGGRAAPDWSTNRVVLDKPLTLRSVNGPQFTVVDGSSAMRCAYLANGAGSIGFTMTNGAGGGGSEWTARCGGGVWCESAAVVVSNCVIAGSSTPADGGGVYSGTLYDCTVAGNAARYGGGAYAATLYNCTLTRNSADEGGGASGGTLYNCTMSHNSAGSGGGVSGSTLTDCMLLRNFAAYYGGGAYHGTLTNCTLSGNSSGYEGGGVDDGTLDNCTLTDNSAGQYGGGACDCILTNCTLTGNRSATGGGACLNPYSGGRSVLFHCSLAGNFATNSGGGASYSMLSNCMLTANSALSGGGAYAGTLNNCTLARNWATYDGGGAYESTLYNCTLTGNSATHGGGGAMWATLNNCTLASNSATSYPGGGASRAILNNCIVYLNTAPGGANFYQDEYGGLLNYCCTTPQPTNGVGNITNAPLFVDYAGRDLRLQSNSPCINAGNNSYVTNTTDLDGNPRIVSGTVDIGAYEYQGAGSVISYAWLQQYGLPTDGSADFTDPDRDGMNNWQEWRCGTCPTNASSVLRLLSPQRTGTTVTVSWQSVASVNYFLERCTNLSATPCFTCATTNLPGQPGTTSYTDTAATNAGPCFYRVGVGN